MHCLENDNLNIITRMATHANIKYKIIIRFKRLSHKIPDLGTIDIFSFSLKVLGKFFDPRPKVA